MSSSHAAARRSHASRPATAEAVFGVDRGESTNIHHDTIRAESANSADQSDDGLGTRERPDTKAPEPLAGLSELSPIPSAHDGTSHDSWSDIENGTVTGAVNGAVDVVTPRPTLTNEVRLPGFPRQETIAGKRPGDRYVRIRLDTSGFQQRAPGTVEPTPEVLQPRSGWGRLANGVKRTLIGTPISTADEIHERLTKVKALAVLSSDAISSVAYATEASLGVLIVAGLDVLHVNLIIAACIAALIIIVGTSYWQTIHAYPHGGGSYIVAKDNLGELPGLIAAASLMIDYVLTVSVSVVSGIDALVSAVPSLTNDIVLLSVASVLIIMIVNLRGIRESGTIFAAPTYLFVGSFGLMIVVGIVRAIFSPGGLFSPATPAMTPTELGWSPAPFTIFLVLTAFASGCSAMTGTEAISNGVPAFKAPEAKNAARTLVAMVTILATLFLGVTYLAWRYGLLPYASGTPSLDSEIAGMLFTGPWSWVYFVIQFATLLVLVLAANTSFADFPRLSSILARDGYLPHLFSLRGDRLAFTTGIVALTALSTVLLVVFAGNLYALINLYALGVFTAFTLSQSGMVVHWHRLRERGGPGWRRSMVINGVGAVATGVVAFVILISKFDRGAWIVVLLVPIFVMMFRAINRHYARVGSDLAATTPIHVEELRHIAIVPIGALNAPALQSIAYALSLTPTVVVVHVSAGEEEDKTLRDNWAKLVEARHATWERLCRGRAGVGTSSSRATRPLASGRPATVPNGMPRLVVIDSPYRMLIGPLLAYIDRVRDRNPDATISVVLPEFVTAHWWERLLHNQTALRLKLAFYRRPGIIVTNIPYHIGGRVVETVPIG